MSRDAWIILAIVGVVTLWQFRPWRPPSFRQLWERAQKEKRGLWAKLDQYGDGDYRPKGDS